MMMLTLRAFTAGLVSMIPNLVPLLVLGAVCGFAWDTIDSDLLAIAMIAIGIAVLVV